MSEGAADPATAVRAYIAALNHGSPDEIAGCVSEDFVNEHTSLLGRTLTGRESYRARLKDFLASFRGLHYEIEQMIVEESLVAVAYRMSARYQRPGNDAAGDCPISIRGMFRFRVEQGRIVHRVDYWDSADFQRQVSGTANAKA